MGEGFTGEEEVTAEVERSGEVEPGVGGDAGGGELEERHAQHLRERGRSVALLCPDAGEDEEGVTQGAQGGIGEGVTRWGDGVSEEIEAAIVEVDMEVDEGGV